MRPLRPARLALVAALFITALLAPVAGAGVVEARTLTGSGSDDALSSSVDAALLDALREAGVLDIWYDSSPHTATATGLRVEGNPPIDEARGAVMELAGAIASSRRDEIELLEEIERAERAVRSLEQLTRTLRERTVTTSEGLSAADIAVVRKVLLQARHPADHESLQNSIATLERVRAALGEQLVAAQRRDEATKAADPGPLSLVLAELGALDKELAELRARAEATTLDEQLLIARVTVAIDDLHELRTLARTDVERLPVVTLDAYLRAGQHGIAGCGVDWTLLAGIGRIESIHGTLGDATVGRDGAVGPELVFGPLLDGGATEFEAAEQAAEAEAEAARLALEAAAEAERLAAEQAERDRLLYGTPLPADDEEEPDPETERLHALYGDDAAKLDDEADLDPREREAERLRLLYGEDAVPERAEDEGDEASEDIDDGFDLDPADFDNGFAVIEDFDEGLLDGNDRWDRAVGPMQFLPETWDRWARDGNGDGVSDPHNLYDAAAGAAAYLCHLEQRSGPSPWSFVLGYNNSDAYVAAVLRVADRLASYEIDG